MKCLFCIALCAGLLLASCTIKISGPESEPDEEPIPDPTQSTMLNTYLPIYEDMFWQFDLSYKQYSGESGSFAVEYEGREIWTCTTARYSDSTFIFHTVFQGTQFIRDRTGAHNTELNDISADVRTRVNNNRFYVLKETGDRLPPFMGDWLHLMSYRVRTQFPCENDTLSQEGTIGNVHYAYQLLKSNGLMQATLEQNAGSNRTIIEYIRKN